MGFFFSSPHETEHKQIKKALKHADLSGAQQSEFMDELEATRKRHGSDRYREDHVKEAMRRLKERTGDSLQGTQIERAGRHVTEHLTGGKETAAPKPEAARENAREFKPLPDRVEVPKETKPERPEPNQEGGEGGRDKAA